MAHRSQWAARALATGATQASFLTTAVVSFIDTNNAVLSYIVDGASATKTITRQLF